MVLWYSIYSKLHLVNLTLVCKAKDDWIGILEETEFIVSTGQYEKCFFRNSVPHFSVQCTLHICFHCGMTLSSNLSYSVLEQEQLPWHCLGSCSNGWISGQGGQMWNCFCISASKRILLFRGMSSLMFAGVKAFSWKHLGLMFDQSRQGNWNTQCTYTCLLCTVTYAEILFRILFQNVCWNKLLKSSNMGLLQRSSWENFRGPQTCLYLIKDFGWERYLLKHLCSCIHLE